MDVVESNQVDIGNSGDYKDDMAKKSLLLKNLNWAIDYLTPNAKQTFTQLKQVFIKALIP